KDDWATNHRMSPGNVPADWRLRRIAVQVSVDPDLMFLDVDAPETHNVLNRELGAVLADHPEYKEFDVATVRGPTRALTQAIAGWANQQVDDYGAPLFAGIRYESRIRTGLEAWALFTTTSFAELQRLPIELTMPELQRAQKMLGVTVH